MIGVVQILRTEKGINSMGSELNLDKPEEILEAEKICKNYKLIPEEREVVLIMDDKDRKWKASVSSPTYMRKFERQGWRCTGTEYYSDGTPCTKFFEATSEKSITIGRAERPKRQGKPMTEEHKAKLQAGRLKKFKAQI